jgi:hypothetical protein
MPKHNSGPIRRRDPTGDDAALSRLANKGLLEHLRASPASALVQAFDLRGVRVAAGVDWVELRRLDA